MAVIHTNTTVGTTATLFLTIPEGNPYTCVSLMNEDNSSVYIGDSTITINGSTKGLTVKKDVPIQIWLHAGDELYAVSAVGSAANALTAVYSVVLE